MKKIYLHIGTEKTGTSAIQNTLQNLHNRRLLKRYDFSLLKGRVYSLLMASWHVPTEKYTIDRVVAYIQNFLQKTSQSHIILTCEAFSTRAFLENGNIHALATALQNCEVQVFLYLRRQDSYAESNWAQKIKNFITSDVFVPEKPSWQNLLDTYAHYFGKEHINVRVYNRMSLYKQDVVCDFLQWVGLQQLIPKREKINSNTSLSPANLRIRLSYIRQNKLTKKMQKKRVSTLTKRAARCSASLPWPLFQELQASQQGIHADSPFLSMLNALLLLEKTPQKNTHMYMSLEERKAYLEQFIEENAIIAHKYVHTENKNLFSDIILNNKISLDSPNTDDLVTVFLPIFVYLAQKIEKLEKENTKLTQKLQQLHILSKESMKEHNNIFTDKGKK